MVGSFFSRRPAWSAALCIVLAGLVAYSDSFSGPFLFDSISSIPENPTIRHLWPLSPVFHPPATSFTATGRPILNLSLALNYAFCGLHPVGYHLGNLLIHLLAALTLWAIVRRTLEKTEWNQSALPVATIAALFWMLNPLQTEAVTYIIQRAESLCGLFYLLTLYLFIRAIEKDPCPAKLLGSVAGCALGMGTKEVMATAPLMIFLYDRTFIAGSFAKAWRQRAAYYTALAATWGILILCMRGSGNIGTSLGFGIGISPWLYAVTEVKALACYLGLTLWPSPLILDYGSGFFLHRAGEVWPYALVVIPFCAAVGWALWKRPACGFLGAWYLLILAPTSTFIPLKDALWDHRLYLSLAAPAVALALGLWRWLGREASIVAFLLALTYGSATWLRNLDYRSPHAIYAATVAEMPSNGRAQGNLGVALVEEGDFAAAIPHFRAAVAADPGSAIAHRELAGALLQTGNETEARAEFLESLQIHPNDPETHIGFAVLLLRHNELPEAAAHLRRALQLKPNSTPAHINLGTTLARQARYDEAIAEFQTALRIDPANAMAQNNLDLAREEKARVDAKKPSRNLKKESTDAPR